MEKEKSFQQTVLDDCTGLAKKFVVTTTHLLEWLKFKRLTIPIVGKDIELLESIRSTADGNVKWYSHLGKSPYSFPKTVEHLCAK